MPDVRRNQPTCGESAAAAPRPLPSWTRGFLEVLLEILAQIAPGILGCASCSTIHGDGYDIARGLCQPRLGFLHLAHRFPPPRPVRIPVALATGTGKLKVQKWVLRPGRADVNAAAVVASDAGSQGPNQRPRTDPSGMDWWLFGHELGHQYQTRDWTNNGITEVAVNLFRNQTAIADGRGRPDFRG